MGKDSLPQYGSLEGGVVSKGRHSSLEETVPERGCTAWRLAPVAAALVFGATIVLLVVIAVRTDDPVALPTVDTESMLGESNYSTLMGTGLSSVVDSGKWATRPILSIPLPVEHVMMEECIHTIEVVQDTVRESASFTILRSKSPVLLLLLDHAGAVIGQVHGAPGRMNLLYHPDYNIEDVRQMFAGHLRTLDMGYRSKGRYRHMPSKRAFTVSQASSDAFTASSDRAPDLVEIQLQKTLQFDNRIGSTTVTVESLVNLPVLDTLNVASFEHFTVHGTMPTTRIALSEVVVCSPWTQGAVDTACLKCERERFQHAVEFKPLADLPVRPKEIKRDRQPVRPKDRKRDRQLQSNVPISPVLGDGMQWYQDRLQLQYTTDTISFLGMDWNIRFIASLYYEDNSFGLGVRLSENNLDIDIYFNVVSANPGAGGSLITLIDEELLQIPAITLFTFGPLQLQLTPGLRWTSKISFAASFNQIYFPLSNKLSAYAELVLSTGCLIFIKVRLGVTISGSLLWNEYQFGVFSQQSSMAIGLALLNGEACAELRYARIPFTLRIAPLCQVCVGFLRCRSCTNCLTGLLASLAVEFNFGSVTTDVLWSSCNTEGSEGLLLNPPSPPPRPPPPPPAPSACTGHPCNAHFECSDLGHVPDHWLCSSPTGGTGSSGYGDGDCYNVYDAHCL